MTACCINGGKCNAKRFTTKLIIIAGSPCVGKTTVAKQLFESYENSAYFDGDWAWCVNPFSVADPRLRNGDKTMSFALSNYLNSDFDYVIALYLPGNSHFFRKYFIAISKNE